MGEADKTDETNDTKETEQAPPPPQEASKPPAPPPPVPPGPPPAPPPPVPSGVPPAAPTVAAPAAGVSAEQAAAQKEAATALAAVLRSTPGIIAELVGGETVAEVQASLTRAKDAYGQVRQQVLGELGAAVPAGQGGSGAAPVPTDPMGLIGAGLKQGLAGRSAQ